MSTDVYRKDQIFYLSEINRKAAAGRLLRAGYILYTRTPIVIHFKNGTPFNFLEWYFMNEYIIDITRVQVCFEHFLKAELLLNGFVIHRFKDKSLYDSLKDNTTKLVAIEDLMKQVSFQYSTTKQRNFISELLEQTLGFNEMIDLYSIHKIPMNVVDILKYNNKIRNVLHFTEAEPQGFDPSTLLEVIKYAEAVMPQRINDLADELTLPNLMV